MKKEPANSPAALSAAHRGAGRVITPPENVPLDARDLPFFANVLDEFARSEWTAHQLELAAMLARTMSDLETEQREMRKEGSVACSDKGTPVVNPRKTVIQMHYSSIHSARRSLSLHARAKSGNPRDVAKSRSITKAAEADAASMAADDLIARPN